MVSSSGAPEPATFVLVALLLLGPTVAAHAGGLIAVGSQLWTQASPGIDGSPEAYDGFGQWLAAGDFNGDGYDDLAIGVHGEDLTFAEPVVNAGMVHVLFGSPGGLTTAGAEVWHQGLGEVPGTPEDYDQLGYCLAAGDLNGDGYDELVIGVPHEDLGTVVDAGVAVVLLGSAAGLTGPGQVLHQDVDGIAGVPQTGDRFGCGLAVGNFNGDPQGYGDLAVGAWGEDDGAGVVHVVPGSAAGSNAFASTLWYQSDLGGGASEAYDQFGWGLAATRIDPDGYDDLVVGAPGEEVNGEAHNGAVSYLYGGIGGLSAAASSTLYGVVGIDADDWYGSGVAAADTDGDGYAEIFGGAPGATSGSPAAGETGVVLRTHVPQSGQTGTYLRRSGDELEVGDYFGFRVAVGDFDADGTADLAVSAPAENGGDGAVELLENGAPRGTERWLLSSPGLPMPVSTCAANLGHSLAVGDFNGDGHDDLASGAAAFCLGAQGTGAVLVLHGALMGDGFESAALGAWSDAVP